ncbi:hypothetical protein Q3G72_005380 [Acer saccharum]|nr:hypothetical protein Q3G72_005380 [Acer saccharum]
MRSHYREREKEKPDLLEATIVKAVEPAVVALVAIAAPDLAYLSASLDLTLKLPGEMDWKIRELTIELNNDNVFYIVNINVQQLEDKVQDIVKNIRELEDEQQLEDSDGEF